MGEKDREKVWYLMGGEQKGVKAMCSWRGRTGSCGSEVGESKRRFGAVQAPSLGLPWR